MDPPTTPLPPSRSFAGSLALFLLPSPSRCASGGYTCAAARNTYLPTRQNRRKTGSASRCGVTSRSSRLNPITCRNNGQRPTSIRSFVTLHFKGWRRGGSGIPSELAITRVGVRTVVAAVARFHGFSAAAAPRSASSKLHVIDRTQPAKSRSLRILVLYIVRIDKAPDKVLEKVRMPGQTSACCIYHQQYATTSGGMLIVSHGFFSG